MNGRERFRAVMDYKAYDRLPIYHFGFWPETLEKWATEGHITKEEAELCGDGNNADVAIGTKLGFDSNYYTTLHTASDLFPYFEREVLEELPHGAQKVLDYEGAVVLKKPGAGSIPAEVDHLLKDRKSWEEIYLPRLQFTEDRVKLAQVVTGGKNIAFGKGGGEILQTEEREQPLGIHCGSLFGVCAKVSCCESAGQSSLTKG